MRYGGFFLLLAVLTVAKYALWLGIGLAVPVLAVTLWRFTSWLDNYLERRTQRRAAARFRRDEIARRADEQNALALAGDDRGIYGDYPPHKDFSPVATGRRAETM